MVDPTYDERERTPFLSASQWQAVLIVVILAALYGVLQPGAGAGATPQSLAPHIIVATPALGPVPTLFPTQPPQVITIERPAAPAAAPVVIDDHSINICIGICPNGSR